jgi:hypothetical protein
MYCHETFPSFNHNLLHFTSLRWSPLNLIYHFPNIFLKLNTETNLNLPFRKDFQGTRVFLKKN